MQNVLQILVCLEVRMGRGSERKRSGTLGGSVKEWNVSQRVEGEGGEGVCAHYMCVNEEQCGCKGDEGCTSHHGLFGRCVYAHVCG